MTSSPGPPRWKGPGCPLVAAGWADGALHGIAFHPSATGLYIELVDRANFPDWEGLLCGRYALRHSTTGEAPTEGIALP